MNLSELQSVQARERQSDSLQELRPSFYQDAADYVAELREERTRVAAEAEDPFEDPRVTQLTDDIRTAQGTIEAIYERRVGKVVKLASLAAADMPTEETGLTTEEQELYDTLVGAIETHREDVLATLTEEGGADVPDGSSTTKPPDADVDRPTSEAAAPADADDAVGAADGVAPESGGPPTRRDDSGGASDRAADADGDDSSTGSEDGQPPDDEGHAEEEDVEEASGIAGTDEAGSSEGADSGKDTERTTVRITEDVGAILGVDQREYDLAADDVVTLPAANADPLIERDAAEPLE